MSRALNFNKRQVFFFAALLSIIIISLLWPYLSSEYDSPRLLWKDLTCGPAPSHPDMHSIPQKYHHIAVASTFGVHHDVYLTVAWTLERIFSGGALRGTVQVYATLPLGYGFQTIVDNLNLYHGDYRNPEDLVRDLNSITGEGAIDMVVLGTCEIDLRGSLHGELLASWDARDDTHKFKLVCIVHHVLDTAWQPAIAEWARRDALRLLPISEHVAKGFRSAFDIKADSTDPEILYAGYEHIPIDVHVPVLDIPDLPEQSAPRILSKAVVQGSFNLARRDYLNLFAELSDSLSKHPEAWGYSPLDDASSYVADPESPDPPFRLYLIGSGWLEVPVELENVVSVHVGLNYTEFYAMMGGMDVCVPAFAENGYYEHQASSTFVMAVECNVPIVVTERMRKSYTYANDDRAVITRPAAMREVAALLALRTGDASEFLNAHPSSHHVRDSVHDMMSRGWQRSKEDFQRFKRGIWRENDYVVERLLRDY